MGALKESSVSLRFFGEPLDPDELTRSLGRTPTIGVRRGQTWRTSKGVEKVARRSNWRLHSERAQPGDLDGQIRAMLSSLTSDLSVWLDLSRRFKPDLFCGLWLEDFNSGLVLKTDTVQLIAERGLKLSLDIYDDDSGKDAP